MLSWVMDEVVAEGSEVEDGAHFMLCGRGLRYRWAGAEAKHCEILVTDHLE